MNPQRHINAVSRETALPGFSTAVTHTLWITSCPQVQLAPSTALYAPPPASIPSLRYSSKSHAHPAPAAAKRHGPGLGSERGAGRLSGNCGPPGRPSNAEQRRATPSMIEAHNEPASTPSAFLNDRKGTAERGPASTARSVWVTADGHELGNGPALPTPAIGPSTSFIAINSVRLDP